MTKEYFLSLKNRLTIIKEGKKTLLLSSGSTVQYYGFIAEISEDQYLSLYNEHKSGDIYGKLSIFTTNTYLNPENPNSVEDYFNNWPDRKAKVMVMCVEEGWNCIVYSEYNVDTRVSNPIVIAPKKGHHFGALTSYFGPSDTIVDGVEGFGSNIKLVPADVEIRIIHHAEVLVQAMISQRN